MAFDGADLNKTLGLKDFLLKYLLCTLFYVRSFEFLIACLKYFPRHVLYLYLVFIVNIYRRGIYHKSHKWHLTWVKYFWARVKLTRKVTLSMKFAEFSLKFSQNHWSKCVLEKHHPFSFFVQNIAIYAFSLGILLV